MQTELKANPILGRRDCLLAMNIGSTESDKRYEVVLKHYSAAFT